MPAHGVDPDDRPDDLIERDAVDGDVASAPAEPELGVEDPEAGASN